MNQTIEDLLHGHSRTGLLLNELACQIKQLQNNVHSLELHVESLRNERDRLRAERDRLQHDVDFRAMGERWGKH